MGNSTSKPPSSSLLPAPPTALFSTTLKRLLKRTEEVLRFVPSPALFQVLDNLSAGLILASVVPLAVVPAVVTEHVLGPFLHVPSMFDSVCDMIGVPQRDKAQGNGNGAVGVGLHLAPWLGPGGAELEARLPELTQYCSTFRSGGFGDVASWYWHSELSTEETALYHLADRYHGQSDYSTLLTMVDNTHYERVWWSYQMSGGQSESNDANDAVMRVTRKGRPCSHHPLERSVAWLDLVSGAPHLSPTQPRPFQNLSTIVIQGRLEVCHRMGIHLALVQEVGALPSLRRIESYQRPLPHFTICALARSPLGRRVQEFTVASIPAFVRRLRFARVASGVGEQECLAEYLFWFSDQCPVITDDDRSLLRRSLTLEDDGRGQQEMADLEVAEMVALARQQNERYPNLEAIVARKQEDTAIMCRDLVPLTFTHLSQLSFRQ